MVGGLGLGAALAVGLAFVFLQEEDVELRGALATAAELQQLTFELSGASRDREESLLGYLLTRNPEALARYDAATRAEAAVSNEIREVAAELPKVLAALAAVRAASDVWGEVLGDPSLSAMQEGEEAETRNDTLRQHLDRVHAATDLLASEGRDYSTQLYIQDESLTATRTLATIAGLGATLLAVVTSLWFVRRYGRELEDDIRRSDVLNRFTEATTFAVDDQTVANATLAALSLLANPDSAVAHVLNPSHDRAVPEATLGQLEGVVLPLKALSGCPGMIRGSIYVTANAASSLSVHCPVYRVDHGTLACVPFAHGETVGAIHLHWDAADAFPLGPRAAVTRVTEHAALAIGNRRLLALLEGQAGTDPKTGLANSRTFDAALDSRLAARLGNELLAVLLLDLDHFKDFNDRNGHPAGDDALRVFAGILRSCMRGGDIAARYGGEEFAVMLPGVDLATAMVIAERIRTRTESTIVPLVPADADRITVSIGVAAVPEHATERVALLQIADAALYRAKGAGRNRVGSPEVAEPSPEPTEAVAA